MKSSNERLGDWLKRVRNAAERQARAKRPRRVSPRLEAVECRVLLSTLLVTNNNDVGPGSLRAEIAAARNHDTIKFAPALAGREIQLNSGELVIDKSVTIQGTFSGKIDVAAVGNFRVFDITSPTAEVTIANLTISGGRAAVGGGVLDQGGTLVLKGDTIVDNMAVGQSAGAPGQGGGLAVIDGGSAVVTGTTFHSNSTLGSLGIFTGSKGGEAEGGAVYAGPSTNLSLAKDNFTNNNAIAGFGVSAGEADGGAVAFTGAALSVVRDSFNGNIALGGPGITSAGGNARGGAVFIQTGSVKFPFVASKSPRISGFHDSFSANVAQGGGGIKSAGGTALGGAVFDQTGSVKIPFVASQFNKNVAVSGNAESITGTPTTSTPTPVPLPPAPSPLPPLPPGPIPLPPAPPTLILPPAPPPLVLPPAPVPIPSPPPLSPLVIPPSPTPLPPAPGPIVWQAHSWTD